MSIDLGIDSVRRLSVRPLLPKIAAVLAELLGVKNIPSLVIERLDAGRRLPVVTDEVGTDDAPLLLISISGAPETVGLVGGSDHLSITMGAQRTNLEFALGAATAIALARELGGSVWDDARFFGEEDHTSPETLLERLRVAGPQADFRAAAERITWGPAGKL